MVVNCFKQKGTLAKFLVVLIIVLIIVLVALFINLMVRKDILSPYGYLNSDDCNSEECIKTSAEIMRYLDQAVNPCEDFYAFVCGGFIKNGKELPPPDPEEELNWMIMEMGGNMKPFASQKLFYQSCINLEAIELDQDETILQMFYALGHWPVLRGQRWNGTFFDWTEFVKRSRRFGMKFDWFLDFSIFEDVNGTKTNVLKVDVPKSLQRIKSEEKSPRKDLLTDVVEFLGAPKYLAHNDAAETIEFEDEVGAIAEAHRERQSEWDVNSLPKLTVNEVQILWPDIRWLELINEITGNRMIDSDYIIFNILDYIKDLHKLIFNTPKRVVANYMMWKVIEEIWPFLSQPIRDKFEKYNQEVHNQLPELNRRKFCLDQSKKLFPFVAEAVYIRRHVTHQKRSMVREMLRIILNHYMQLLDRASWMNRESRRKSLTKVQDIKFMIGGPDEIFDQFLFAENLGFYGFGFKSTNIIDMLSERRLRFYDRYFKAINRMIANNTIKFYENVINITTFSVINQNIIVIPAAIVRNIFYSPNLPNYLNYGALAKVLAQEIFKHIYKPDDYVTSNYNSQWINDAINEPINCLIKESSYFHNSELKTYETMRKNLNNFLAPDVAYESYHQWLQMNPYEAKLPALKFTPQQLFWIQTSKISCSKSYTKHHRDSSRLKIMGPLRNSRNFAKDFNCPLGSKMNPKRKCRIL